jgi:hypothetical protein
MISSWSVTWWWVTLLATGSTIPVAFAPSCRLWRQVFRDDLYEIHLVELDIVQRSHP